MKTFTEKTFNIPELKGISAKSIEEHLKLYSGYVKNANLILEHGGELAKEGDKYSYEMSELQRRFAFEYNGIRNHEYYFAHLEGGSAPITTGGALEKEMQNWCGSVETFVAHFKKLASTRGVGWAMLYWDPIDKTLLTQWIDEQHLGQLNGCRPILALDMWEHSFVADYQPSGKKQYIEDFFENLNWQSVEKNFEDASI
jgi:Fe-Mn family superoxide dismutase